MNNKNIRTEKTDESKIVAITNREKEYEGVKSAISDVKKKKNSFDKLDIVVLGIMY